MTDGTNAITEQFFTGDCKHGARQKAQGFVRVNEAITTGGTQAVHLQNCGSLV